LLGKRGVKSKGRRDRQSRMKYVFGSGQNRKAGGVSFVSGPRHFPQMEGQAKAPKFEKKEQAFQGNVDPSKRGDHKQAI